jgi:hypothetical protein
MARIGRWCGAIVVEAGGVQVLVGNPKEPCALVPDALEPPYVRALTAPVPLTAGVALDDGEPAALARLVAARLLIARNGSVSERLWRLLTHDAAARAQWLIEVPAPVWEIVRDTVLRCS